MLEGLLLAEEEECKDEGGKAGILHINTSGILRGNPIVETGP